MSTRPPSASRVASPAVAALPRVLLIDDDAALLATAAAILDMDFEVETCPSAMVAAERLATRAFDVVCTDYQMPDMNGIQLLDRIAKTGLVVGLVVLTGRYEQCAAELRSRAPDHNTTPVAVLKKPYQPQDLIDAIHRANGFARVRRALRGIGSKADAR